MPKNLLELNKLCVTFPGRPKPLAAVRQLTISAPPASISCLVGESGCGKSLACRAILRLIPEYATLGGAILFQGRNLLELPERELRKIRGAQIAMIFQEPMTSLNPVLPIGLQTAEPLRLHLGLSKKAAQGKVIDLFKQVGIPAPETRYRDYPHQLSGGMRQRVMIAMALACSPILLLADEPTTALDATIQGQILRLIHNESQERGMAVLLITHDLGVVAEVADFVGVMYAGALMEYAPTALLFREPLHPYTQGLIAAQPGRSAPSLGSLLTIPGVVPTLENIPSGCPFEPRCSRAMQICVQQPPPPLQEKEHMVSCWLYA